MNHLDPTYPAVPLKSLRISMVQARWCFSFVVGATVDWPIQHLPVAEILLAALALRVLWQRARDHQWPSRLLGTRAFHLTLGGLLLTFLGYAISDFANQDPFHNVLTGWTRLALLAVDLVALTHLVGVHWHNLVALVTGRLAGMLAGVLLLGDGYTDDWWRSDFALPTTFALLLIVRNTSLLIWGPAMALMGLAQVLLGQEMLGATCIVIGVVALVPALQVSWHSVVSLIVVVASIGCVAWIGVQTAPPSIPAGAHPLAGPADSAVEGPPGWRSLLESPLLGYSSRSHEEPALDSSHNSAEATASTTPPFRAGATLQPPLQPSLVGALLEGGLLGGAFFGVFAALLLRATLFAARRDFPLRPLTLFLLALAALDLFAIAFSGMARFEIATAAALGVALLAMKTSLHRRPSFSVAWN